MPRGGPRPNSGAPKGNLNALKHGRSSVHYRRLMQAIVANPEARGALLAVAKRQRRVQARARKEAEELFRKIEELAAIAAARRYELNRRIPPVSDTNTPPRKLKNEKTTKHQT
jgi:predicted oxidoreductase